VVAAEEDREESIRCHRGGALGDLLADAADRSQVAYLLFLVHHLGDRGAGIAEVGHRVAEFFEDSL
jgi:hypothetical protein